MNQPAKSRRARAQVAGWLAGAIAVACYGGSESGGPGGAGTVALALELGTSVTIDSVAYAITGPGGYSKSGTTDVSGSSTLTARLSAIPQGTGYSIALTATARDGGTACSGSAPFDVVADQTTPVDVRMTCIESPRTGSILVNGSLNICPSVNGIAGVPADLVLGEAIQLLPVVRDIDGAPSPLAYSWSATNGTLTSTSIERPSFTCAAEGLAVITLGVSDGDITPGCAGVVQAQTNCFIPRPDAGVEGDAGSGGASGTGGAPATGGTENTGGVPESGGTPNTGGVPETGGTPNTGGVPETGGAPNTGGTTASNVVVYRVGDGSVALANTGIPVFVDEYTPAGSLVRTIALPTAVLGANRRLVASGTATSEGLLSRSADGRFVVLTGYDSALPAASSLAGTTGAAVPRTIGLLDATGTVNTATALTDGASGNNPRSATSTDGLDLWFSGGAGGIRHAVLGASTSVQLSTTVVNLRQTHVFGAQLFVSTASGPAVRLGAVGAGLPTTAGQVITNLPGLSPSGGSPYGFFFADLDASVPGFDVLYVADDTAAALTKYSLVSGSWVSNGTLGAAADAYRGLTGFVEGSTVTLYATRRGGSTAAGGGELVRIADAAGYNAPIDGAPALLVTAVANTAFRGVALAPNP